MTADQVLRLLEIAAFVAVLSLDQVALGQFMLSQPLVGGALVGWAFGDPGGGLIAGAYYQTLCLVDVRVGGSIPPDNALAGLIGAAAVVGPPHVHGLGRLELLGLLTVFFVPVALLGRYLEAVVCRANRVWANLAESLVGLGHLRLAQAAALGGTVFFFLRAFVLAAAVLLLLGLWAGRGLAGMPGLPAAFGLLARLVPLVGLSALVVHRRRPGWAAALAAGVLLAQVAAWGGRP